ncbi:acyltransferase family protein [Cutibacterium equinum]|uniref:Acyltransferase family protein n=1 Tax=Cutibacterium equinum TaxID=3016342 RepID=A0ABY7R064_9ACTN|nr:acyltransferase family protein [Cutibacterium equinum]WCC80129.1 acyltransferase family protein [Cutibacterium equinum]
MDSLRGLAVVLVVLHHAVGVPRVLGVGEGLLLPGWDGFVAFFSSFRMPTLLVMSGMLLATSVRKPLIPFISGKIRKVLWPYVVWVLLTLTALGGLSTVTNPRMWLTGPYHMWFLVVLLFCYPAGWLSRWIPAWLMAVGMVALLVVRDPSSTWIRRVLFYGAIFMMGAALRRYLPSLLAMPGWIAGLLGVVGLSIACSHSFRWGLAQLNHRQVWTLLLPWGGSCL